MICYHRGIKGLTITELLAVILIIGLLVLVAIPTFTKFGTNVRLKSASQQIASILRMAQSLAVTNNVAHSVWIYTRQDDPKNHIYVTDQSTGLQAEKVWSAPQGIEIPDVTNNEVPTEITFSPKGTADISNGSSIHIITKGTIVNGNPYDPSPPIYAGLSNEERVKCYTITVDGNTGRSRVYKYGRNSPWSSTDL